MALTDRIDPNRMGDEPIRYHVKSFKPNWRGSDCGGAIQRRSMLPTAGNLTTGRVRKISSKFLCDSKSM
jgi:hypothetical protein